MTFRLCDTGCGRYLDPGDGHDYCFACLGLGHAEVALMDASCFHCGNMTISVLRSRLQYLEPLLRSTPPSQPPRAPHSSMTLQPVELPEGRTDLSCGVPVVTFGAPPDDQMSIAASEGKRMSSGDEDSAALPPLGVADPEMAAMLSWAAVSVGLEWNPPPCPEPSRLDDWFLGAARAGSQYPTPVPFFPEVHEEVTKLWTAPFSARNPSGPSSILTTLDGGVAKGYVELPPVEWSVAMRLCPKTSNSWRGNPRLPSRACKFSSSLAVKAYTACGEAASALHAMALLQVHQAKALQELHEGSSDPGLCRNCGQQRTSPYGRRKLLHVPWVGRCPP
ncbi:Uroporphyrinogen decarboxylase [Labeo rohita]|uniref:Uroporphyrinogen decarboxylase n=1 Tax=Labeo rohita TaxID=84645 RepID=A0ABQ8LJ20_LABRO|nr:Uroporphyrinogen decarboxylase [Labeo rohita]